MTPLALVVPGATVTATNQATKASRNADTATDGSFSLSLPPGAYTITASLYRDSRESHRWSR